MIREKFKPYLTSVGGSGLGILSPYHIPGHLRSATRHRAQTEETGQATPPPETAYQDNPLDVSVDLDDLRTSFETIVTEELGAWADGLGRWLYV